MVQFKTVLGPQLEKLLEEGLKNTPNNFWGPHKKGFLGTIFQELLKML
jgi:hypothetical protein